MIEIANIRKSGRGGVVRLEADITFTNMPSPYAEKTLYFEVAEKDSDMLADDTYDAFVLVPLYLAMYHKQDLHICGNISKKFYQNLKWYVPRILCDFSDDLSPVKLIVDGFTSPKPKGNLIGTGISCGVDSLSTIYDHFIKETDPDYKINSLFLFNYGSCGGFGDPITQKFFEGRYRRNVNAAYELGLPIYAVDTNLYAFTNVPWITFDRLSYCSIYSCILALQNAIFRYYTSSTYNYSEIKKFDFQSHNFDMAEFCESYLIPLIQTENFELIIDGCQYRRVDKLKKIVDWNITQKYLNVCITRLPDAFNCGYCQKCLRTLLPLEIMGKLDKFSRIFNIEQYKRNSFNYKIQCLQKYDKAAFETENVDFARENNFPMPIKTGCYVLGKNAMIVNE